MCAVAPIYKRQHDAITPTCLIPENGIAATIVTYAQNQQGNTRTRKRRRLVRINEQDNEEHNVVVDSNAWLSKEDYGRIRKGMGHDIWTVTSSQLGPKTLLDETVYSRREGASDEVLEQVPIWESSSEGILENFKKWTHYIDPGRGLESKINSEFGKAKRKHRTQAIRAILVGQGVLREEKNNAETGTVLSLISQKYSALARQHALLMGMADEEAAQAQFY
mmetsp:Transcript_24199/g.35618  ORF Transcript_24199/g.35618 Transcript_24199/m.35618 type:complete len:221 (-) Transcript_24199:155-817(-)